MPSFEEDALARAQQMHRRNPQQNANRQSAKQNPESETIKTPQKPAAQTEKAEQNPNDGVLNALFKDKEQSLILLLIVLLMEEKSNPSLLLALIYLLI